MAVAAELIWHSLRGEQLLRLVVAQDIQDCLRLLVVPEVARQILVQAGRYHLLGHMAEDFEARLDAVRVDRGAIVSGQVNKIWS